MACLYRGMHEGTVDRVGLESYDPRLHLMEQYSIIFKMFVLLFIMAALYYKS